MVQSIVSRYGEFIIKNHDSKEAALQFLLAGEDYGDHYSVGLIVDGKAYPIDDYAMVESKSIDRLRLAVNKLNIDCEIVNEPINLWS